MRREITKEQYVRAIANGGQLIEADMETVFSDSERCGYGVYGRSVTEDDGEYYVLFSLGSTCD